MDDIDFLRVRFLEVNETVAMAMITVARKSRQRHPLADKVTETEMTPLADGITQGPNLFIQTHLLTFTASTGTG